MKITVVVNDDGHVAAATKSVRGIWVRNVAAEAYQEAERDIQTSKNADLTEFERICDKEALASRVATEILASEA